MAEVWQGGNVSAPTTLDQPSRSTAGPESHLLQRLERFADVLLEFVHTLLRGASHPDRVVGPVGQPLEMGG